VEADGDRLLVLLGRVRGRIRAQAALQGGIAGALIALLAVNLALLAIAGRTVLAMSWLAALALGPLLGALWSVWRRPISLGAAARRVDRAASTGLTPSHGDRVFIGFSLLGQDRAGLAGAAVEDAVRRARETPLAQVAPWRRPRGLGLLAAFGTIAVGLAVWPWRSVAQSGTPAGSSGEAAVRAPRDGSSRLEARAELDRLQRAAGLAGDTDLMALIAQAERLLAPGRDRNEHEKEILEQLAAVASAARASAQTGATLAEAFARVAEALAGEPQTRGWAQALSRLEARASEREAQAAAERLSEGGAAERAALAQSLDRAAAAVQDLSRTEAQRRQQVEAEEKRRRLGGLEDEKSAPAADGQRPDQTPRPSPERSLKRLERDLSDSADLCRKDPAACARAMSQAAESLGSEMSGARSSGERDQLARTLERELAQQQQGAGGQSAGQPGAAGRPGEASQGRAAPARRGPGSGPNLARGEANGAGESGTGTAGGAEPAEGASAAEGSGEGVGAGSGGEHGSGGDPERGRPGGPQGEKHEVRVPAGPGPSRAQVIEGGARRGFTEPGYRRVYREYEAAVEEALDATAVPPGRRRLVRRYFELIHPR
jgi:hypothetical protein